MSNDPDIPSTDVMCVFHTLHQCVAHEGYRTLMYTIKMLSLPEMETLFKECPLEPIVKMALCLGCADVYRVNLDDKLDCNYFMDNITDWVNGFTPGKAPTPLLSQDNLPYVLLLLEGLLGKYVTRLYLTNHQLTSLPECIGNLANLELLHLNNNQLTTLPNSLATLDALELLNIRGNQFSVEETQRLCKVFAPKTQTSWLSFLYDYKV